MHAGPRAPDRVLVAHWDVCTGECKEVVRSAELPPELGAWGGTEPVAHPPNGKIAVGPHRFGKGTDGAERRIQGILTVGGRALRLFGLVGALVALTLAGGSGVRPF
jgi:hypothetical protein